MRIDVFSRFTSGPGDAAEQDVLRRVISIVECRREDAAILVNMLVDRHEIDLVVATETATLVIEVKGYRQPIKGSINERCWATIATGEARSNAYEKIDSASLTLKDELRDDRCRPRLRARDRPVCSWDTTRVDIAEVGSSGDDRRHRRVGNVPVHADTAGQQATTLEPGPDAILCPGQAACAHHGSSSREDFRSGWNFYR